MLKSVAALAALLFAFATIQVEAQIVGTPAVTPPADGKPYKQDGKWIAPPGPIPIPINFVDAGGAFDKQGASLWITQKYRHSFSAKVGQNLLFEFGVSHDLYLMPGSDAYVNCDFSQAVKLGSGQDNTGDPNDINRTNKVLYKLGVPGGTYFACSTRTSGGSHCRMVGQKIRVDVTPKVGTCQDGVKNVHEDGKAELGIDCGGPCAAECNFCLDGRQNGDESGVDCGGSCGRTCPVQCPPAAVQAFKLCRQKTTSADCTAANRGCSWCEGGESGIKCTFGLICSRSDMQGTVEYDHAKCINNGGAWDDSNAIKDCGKVSCPEVPQVGSSKAAAQVGGVGVHPPKDAAVPVAAPPPTDDGQFTVILIIFAVVVIAIAGILGVNYIMSGNASNRAKERFDLGTSPVKV